MKLVSGLFDSIAAEHRAIVGELRVKSAMQALVQMTDGGDSPSRNDVCKIEVLDRFLEWLSCGLTSLVLVH